MKLNISQRIGSEYLISTFTAIFRDIERSVNSIAEGKQAGFYTASTAAPTTGTYSIGDFVLNSAPSEAGTTPNKYLIHGWRCTASGTPGTWKECRFLTGN